MNRCTVQNVQTRAYLIELSQILSHSSSNKDSVKKGTIRKYDCIQRIRFMEIINYLFKEIDTQLKNTGTILDNNEEGKAILLDLIVIWANTRAIRTKYGNGNRLQSYWIFTELYRKYPSIMYWFLYEIPHYGSYLDLNNIYELIHLEQNTNLMSYKLKDDIAKMYAMALFNDIQFVKNNFDNEELIDNNITYAAKWVPKEGRSLDKCTKITSHIVKYLHPRLFKTNRLMAMKQFRYDIGLLNKYLKTTEKFMAGKKFSKINFKEVPKKCLTRHTKAWKGIDDKGIFKHYGDLDRVNCSINYNIHLIDNKLDIKKGKHLYYGYDELVNSKYNTNENWRQLRDILDFYEYDPIRNIADCILPWRSYFKGSLSQAELNNLPKIYTPSILALSECNLNNLPNTPLVQIAPAPPNISFLNTKKPVPRPRRKPPAPPINSNSENVITPPKLSLNFSFSPPPPPPPPPSPFNLSGKNDTKYTVTNIYNDSRASTPDSMPELEPCSPIQLDDYTNLEQKKNISNIVLNKDNSVENWVQIWKPLEQPKKIVDKIASLERFIIGKEQAGTMEERIKNLEFKSFGYCHTSLTIEDAIKNLEVQLL